MTDDPTGWFEPLYAAAARGEREVPWDRGEPREALVEWASARDWTAAGAARWSSAAGSARRVQQVGHDVRDRRARMKLLRAPHRTRGDAEGRYVETRALR